MLPDREPATPGDATLALAERDRIERELDLLGIEQRAVIVLVYYLGLSLNDVAVTLDIPVGTAKSRLHYAIEALRAAITAEERTSVGAAREGRMA